ncbi:MAG: hypothetical protein JKY43_02145 [Phycisphaerales bacterium]|nr:hypothetical protein [Phycisphaerales bacterium]
MRYALSCTALFTIATGTCLAAGPVSVQDARDEELVSVHGCFGDENGNLSGGIFQVPMDGEVIEFLEAMDRASAGALDNRLDLVIVGDGYTAGEMGQFHVDADGIVNSLYQYEPFTSYQSYFRVTKVEVVSNESGVDNDPSPGIFRDTALDMLYWCSNIERLLCINVGKAYTAAAAAPDIDQIIAISNSSKYGGAGYSSNNLGTAAGQNSAAADVAIHELGHSLGDLADEYTYGGPVTYTGGELVPVNVSIYDQSEQVALSRKWYNWMGASTSGFDNPIGAYEGGNYSQLGVYRPSSNSMMRALGRPFNLVNAEKLLKEIYREVSPIDDGTADGTELGRDDSAWIVPMRPLNHDLTVLWYLDGVLRADLIGDETVDIASLGLDDQEHELRVVVVDGINWVRNEAMRDQFMTKERVYTIPSIVCSADINGDGVLDFFDISAFLTLFSAGDLAADFSGDGTLDFFDISMFLGTYAAGCP